MRRLELHHRILIGMGVGFIIGGFLNYAGQIDQDPVQPGVQSILEPTTFQSILWYFNVLGKDVFIGSLKMLIAPLIFASIINGVTSLPGMHELGSIGGRTFAYYFITTGTAVAIGLATVLLLAPGHRQASKNLRAQRAAQLAEYREEYKKSHPSADLNTPTDRQGYLRFIAEKEGARAGSTASAKWMRLSTAQERSAKDMLREDILLPILTNPIKSLAETNSLGIIFFAILIGLACLALGEQAAPVTAFFQGLNDVMMKITLWVMNIAPVSIGCLIVSTVASQGIDALVSLGWYCITVIVGIACHVAFLITLVALLGGRSPRAFIRGIRTAWLVAFSTTSSAATLPVTMECVNDNLGVDPRVSNFSLPVGATCNMDGTALYEGVAVIFLIQMYAGLDDVPLQLTAASTLVIFITAVLASIGAAAVPSAGLITMAIVAGAVGLPLHYVPMIFAVDHFLDMFRTSTNVLGDAAGAVIVDRWERKRLARENQTPKLEGRS